MGLASLHDRSNQAGLKVMCLSTRASGQSLGLSIPALPAALDMMSCTKRLMESGCAAPCPHVPCRWWQQGL
ncbi:hypothetical protein HaLaN_10931 [Haematococcus lacustris]|uniref:Uncharacterized protein n=1 Tax=Haematococcus lacustris TaxID=44745 RepID=A0A699YYS1_HAELA|nr:hypothetical protein HaLaN_10931 [Haematococcus lacustris]